MPMKPDFVFSVAPSKLKIFHFLLQQGLRMETQGGDSVEDFLVRQLGLNPEVIDEKIQTIFLNGKAVDDLSQAILTDGASLALSGALPGLVGATMRRGGFYSASATRSRSRVVRVFKDLKKARSSSNYSTSCSRTSGPESWRMDS